MKPIYHLSHLRVHNKERHISCWTGERLYQLAGWCVGRWINERLGRCALYFDRIHVCVSVCGFITAHKDITAKEKDVRKEIRKNMSKCCSHFSTFALCFCVKGQDETFISLCRRGQRSNLICNVGNRFFFPSSILCQEHNIKTQNIHKVTFILCVVCVISAYFPRNINKASAEF